MIRIRKQLLCSMLPGVLFQSAVAVALPDAGNHAFRQDAARTVIVVDSAVKNASELLQTPVPGNDEILFLKPGDDPVESIGRVLYGKKVQSLHIVSHGSPGQIILANRIIDDGFLKAHRRELRQWSSSLVPGANILLYGCDVAQGAKGREFVGTLSAITSIAVAASVNKTGHSRYGADWNLEFSTGAINPAVFISEQAQKHWMGMLAAGFAVTESSGSTVVSETGSTDTFDVVLTGAPASDVVIDVSSGDTGEATVSPASLTFTTGNWNVAQTVTVTGADDALNDRTQSTAVTLSINDAASDNNFDPLPDQVVTVDTLDDEANASPANNLPSSQNINEDGFLLFNAANGNKISITDDAGENLEVTIGVANGALTLSQITGLTFTSGDGAADATMTFSGTVEDINSALDGLRYDPSADFNGSETLTIASSDKTLLSYDLDANIQGYYKFDSGDTNGDSGPNGAPDGTLLDNATFAVDATRGDVLSLDGVDDGFDVATRFGQPNTFTLAAWVNVTGVDTNAADIINIGDNILIRADASTVNNWGDGVSATIFTAPSTWTILKSGQYIAGTGWHHVAFTYDNGTGMARLYLDGVEVVAMASATPDWSLVGSTTRIGKHGATDTTADLGGYIDDARIYNRALSATEVSELYLAPTHTTDSGTVTITVAPVNDPPAGTVTIDNTSPQVTDTLTASNTLTDIDGISGAISYQWRRDGVNISGATGSTYSVVAADIGAVISVTASYTDDDGTAESVNSADTAAVVSSGDFTITESGGSTAVSESGTTDTFTVVLAVQPASDVVIDISSGDTGEATVSPASLTFTNGNWNVAQTVTVTGVNDSIIDGTQNTTVTLAVNDAASDDNYDPVADKTVTASTADNDAAGFTIVESGGNTSVDESGTTDTFTVVLTAQPASDVVIDVSSGDTGEATVGPASLTFTNGNWNVAQTVTVTGVDDALIDGTQNTTITLSINDAASDDSFDPLADQTVTTATADDDAAGFSITESGGSTSVDESGTTDTFTVVLTAQPNSDVVIDIGSGDTGEATVSPASLTFTNGNWNVAQTVTVTGVDDILADGTQNTTITLSVNDAASDDNFDPLADQTVAVSTTDDDSAGFAVIESGGNTSVNESGTADTFTVVLTAQPVNDVVIDVSSGDTGEATVSPASLTFTNGNWNVAQTVTVTGVDDALIDGNRNTTITLSINDAASDDNFDPLADQTVTAVTVDNDSAGFTVTESGGSTSVNESGTTDTFTVVLTAQPNSDVVIDVSSGDTGEATISSASLTFTNGNWNVAQTVTVTGVDDALIDGNRNTTITLSINDAASDDNFDPLADQTVTAVTVDNDSAGFTVTESGGSTSVNESGTTDTFTVVLTAQPNSDVVIDVSSGDTGEATVSPASLTFTNGNWNVARTVTVTGVNDVLVDGVQNTTITLSINDAASDDNFDPLADQAVTASTVDDDSAGFTVVESGGNTSVDESGTTDTFTVVLNAQPVSDVVIDIGSGDTGEATVSPASLTFTNGNWNVARTVTVTGVDDALIDGTQNTTITVSVNDAASDDSFDPLADQTVTAATADDDSAGFAVTESGGNTSVNESGTTDTFTVVLTAQPASDVVIDVSSGDTGEATVGPASLTFTNGNWNVAQTVTVTGVDDALIDGNRNTTITLSVNDAASDDNFDPLVDQTVTATTVDNDAAGFTIVESGGNTSVNESGTTDTFTVVLTAQPNSDVVIDVSSGDTGEATVSPASLTFTNGNWNVAQTVTVTGVDDTLIDGNRNTTITLSINDAASDDNFDPLADQAVTATTVDNDAAGFTVVESGGNTSVNESGTTDTFTVVLNAQPNSDVVIDVSSGDTGEATVGPASLTFTNGNWNVAQTVTVTGVDDALIDGNRNTTITLSINDAASDDNFDPLSDQAVSVTTIDNDAAGFTVIESGGNTSVNESGATDTFTVVLNAQPNSDVVIDVSSGDTGEATVSPASLTFTNGNWNVAQTVTVTGVNDNLIDGTQNTAITLTINDAASDDNFDPLADQTVTAATVDDDAAGFGVTESGGSTSVNESGTTDTFTVVLSAQPNSDVVIDISSADTGEVTVGPASLTFTNGNWNVAQTVTVTGVNDSLIDGTQNTAITLSINDAASDDNFDPLTDQVVAVATVDNDSAGFAIVESGGSTSVNESGTTDTFTVVLTAQPNSDVVIDVSSGDTGEATAGPASLTFTNGNWNVAQTVTVTGVDDTLVDGAQNTTVTLSVNDAASDDNFDPLADQTVTVTTVDNDTAGFTVVESGGGTSVNESGTTDTFTVVLNAQPNSNVVIDINSGDTGEATVSPASLTFTNGNWSTAQTVTVAGVDDALVDGSQNTVVTVSVNAAASDDNFDPLSDQTVTVTTADNDAAGFTVVESGGNTSVNESGTTDTFTVVLNAQPNSDVVIDIGSGDTGEATVSPANLTFTAGNWNVAQTVTVTGVDDALLDGDQNTVVTVSINDAASDDDYDPLPDQTVTVTTVDDDTAGFTVTESGGNTAVNESGTTDTLMVTLNAQPAGNVVIDLSSGDTGEATVGPASLTFTAGNWNVAQTVTVTGVDDLLIDGSQSITITLTINDAASDDNFDPLPDQTVTVTVVDDDTSPDADNDGIPNIVEGMADTDFDGTPDFLDTDSDNDGIPDRLEAGNIPPLTGIDADSDGIDDVIDVDFTGGVDMNADGVDDAFEPVDSDGDGTADYLDADSDNDGIPDGIEADNVPALTGSDADGDGIDDALDVGLTGGPDADGNGVDDRYEPRDTDGDGLADYLDSDSDNDGIHDSIEGNVLFADSDGDGIDDRYDIDVTGGADIDSDGADDNAAPDSDADGRPDYRDLDSDNDGLPDVIEAGLADVDGDGFADGAITTLTPQDTDFNGTADYRDLDSDNDGVFDIVAAGYTQYDVNNDGRIDAGFFVDPDNDGVPNVIDPAPAVFGLLNNSDSDGDGVPDSADMDDDNDGIPDAIESPGGVDIDSDGDGIVDRLDRDSDNDGIPDSAEAFYSFELDSDLDGVIDDTTDTDLDGLADVVSASMVPEDTDSDGIPDYRDLDSDNDGLYDLLELSPENNGTLDANKDGRVDSAVDSDGDGLADVFDPDSGSYLALQIPDSENDGIADFRDTDSDNDGFSDSLENGDFNGNGIMDFVESGRGITTSIPNGGGGGGSGWLWIVMLLLFNRQKTIRRRA